jgi:hypothetical protein
MAFFIVTADQYIPSLLSRVTEQIRTRTLGSVQHVIQQGQYLAIEFLFENIHPGVLKDNTELLKFCLKENVGYCYP